MGGRGSKDTLGRADLWWFEGAICDQELQVILQQFPDFRSSPLQCILTEHPE